MAAIRTDRSQLRVRENAFPAAKMIFGGSGRMLYKVRSRHPVSPSGAAWLSKRLPAGVVELVDTLGLGPSGLTPLGVRVPPPAPGTTKHLVTRDIDGRPLCKLLKPLPKA